jgi:hypothetical protein
MGMQAAVFAVRAFFALFHAFAAVSGQTAIASARGLF